METKTKSVYETLSAIDCRKVSRKKNGLTYLPWAWAWARVKENYPAAFYTIYENKDGLNYHTDGKTAWVKTGVTIEGLEHIEYLPVMDFRNQSIAIKDITSFAVNKSIQRSLTKACARHGLGLYIFAGEDMPEDAEAIDDANREEGVRNGPTGASKAEAATAAPSAAKAPQGGGKAAPKMADALKAKAKEAWCIFKTLDSVKSMDENSRSRFFFTTLQGKVGKSDPAKLTLEEWDRVINELDALKAI